MRTDIRKIKRRVLWLSILVEFSLGSALVHAADICCSIVKFNSTTRVVTVRETATGDTYQCKVPESQDSKALKAGAKVGLNLKTLKRMQPGETATAANATKCGGWNGPRGAETRPLEPTKPKSEAPRKP